MPGRASSWAVPGAVALAVCVPVATRAGFTAPSRALLLALAGLALLAAVVADERRALRTARAPVVPALAALALISVLSAAWTVGEPADSVRWGLVVAAYAALAVAASVIGRPALVAGGVVALAALCGLVGLVALAVQELPYAQRQGGSWRPGGPFEYAPALALLQVMALAPVLHAMSAARVRVAAGAAVAGAIAAAVLALAGTRVPLAAALVVAAVVVAAPPAGVARSRVVAAVVLLAGAGALAEALFGGFVGPRAEGGDAGRLVGLALLAALAALAWWAVRRRTDAAPPRPQRAGGRGLRPRTAALLAIAGCVVVVVVGSGAAPSLDPVVQGTSRTGGFTHGRVAIWQEAARTWMNRPVLGSGADTYFLASAEEQRGRRVRYAHNLPLEAAAETGVAGLLATLALFAAAALALWRARRSEAGRLLGPAVAVFLVANLVDWSWHLGGLGAVWAVALGAVLAADDTSAPVR